jgi:hypothetical protein
MVRVGRRLVVRAGAVFVALAAVAALGLPGASASVVPPPGGTKASTTTTIGDTTCVATGVGSTCTGTYGGDTAWEPTGVVTTVFDGSPFTGTAGQESAVQPQVTVSQTRDLVNQEVQVSWKNFTPTTNSGWPPNTLETTTGSVYQVGVFECRGTDPQAFAYPSGDCYNIPTNTSGEGGGAGASNGVTTYTQLNGTGQVNFYVEAGSQNNSFLDCDVNTPCSLVVVPNWGGEHPTSIFPFPTDCSNHELDFGFNGFAGTIMGANTEIGTACSWADRIVVPLSFEPTASNCPQTAPSFYSEGSPMLERAMEQWIPGWCTGSSPLSFAYTFRTTELQARTAFLQPPAAATAPVDVALTTLPPDAAATAGSTRKFTYAPLAVSAVAVSYYIEDPTTHTPITHLVLNATLLAKLLTQSYALGLGCTSQPPLIIPASGPQWPPLPAPSASCDPAVYGNQQEIWGDPEFLALNKDCQPFGEPADYTCTRADFPNAPNTSANLNDEDGAFLPTVLAGNSDMTYELTRWIASSPASLGFIDGQLDTTDGSDMHVNENYWDQAYPISQFATLDPGAPYPAPITCSAKFPDGEPGDCDHTIIDNGTMQATWIPVEGLDTIATDLASYQPTAQNGILQCPSTIASGCTSVNQLSWGGLPQETLEDRSLFSVVDEGDAGIFDFPTAYLVNAAGNEVAPTTASMDAALQDMETNPDGITQYSNDTTTDPNAYPVTMVDYAMVPTCGLSSAKASAITQFLTKVATTGQVQGVTPGTLAPGYAPLDAKQRAQTLAAAQAVKSQDCQSAPPDTTVSGLSGVNDVGAAKAPAGSTTPATGASKSPSASTRLPGARIAAYGSKSPLSGLGSVLLLLALICGVLLVLGGPMVWVLVATGKWPALWRWLRPVVSRLRVIPGQLAGLGRRA